MQELCIYIYIYTYMYTYIFTNEHKTNCLRRGREPLTPALLLARRPRGLEDHLRLLLLLLSLLVVVVLLLTHIHTYDNVSWKLVGHHRKVTLSIAWL